uniref:DNA 3'-5' helicase n=1 Tax=Tetradesmus obliquus TaxID=3088 RepID=A0A383WM30_TETOB|eukprot:jgi/Sobl393_1/638/SZX78520.1
MCQFELVQALTSPSSSLFMVGDPDQGIYGFRGAKSALLAESFSQLYGPTAATRSLSENYRSREPIVQVAELVRRHGKLSSSIAASGRSRQPVVRLDTVVLMEARNEYDEADQVVLQLRKWHKDGYVWGEMAVLFRAKRQVAEVYKKAIAAGVPCHLWSREEFFEAPEVSVALALLRCLVDPLRAGDSIRKRLVKKGSPVKVPLMSGLGPDSFDALAAAAEAAANSSTNSSSSLGGCLLGDLPLEPSSEQAIATLHQYSTGTAAGADPTEALQGLAAGWQPPAGAKKLTNKQAAAVGRLRGLVLLGRAAAAVLRPEEVLELLLGASGVRPELQAALEALQAKASKQRLSSKDSEDLKKLRKRRDNLDTLLKLARNTRAYTESPVLGLDAAEPAANAAGLESGDDGGESDAGMPNSSSSSSSSLPLLQPTTGLPLLQQLYDYCVLQGEDDEDERDAQKVQLMTMHASKGKEFACVALLRLHDDAMPSIHKDDAGAGSDVLDQERNLLYVAITRAKEHCLMIWPGAAFSREAWREEPLEVSRFLKPVLSAVSRRQLPGVQQQRRHFIERESAAAVRPALAGRLLDKQQQQRRQRRRRQRR